ncbi:MAG: MFS transporter, partial [archaeon]|nr:MFS transporter [archaeon]
MSLESNISKYYIYFVFRFSLFVAPIFTLFYFDLGYTLLETVFISSTVFYLTWVVFEIPTGIFADKFGRKKSMVIGSTFLVVGGLLIIWAPSFEALVVASFLTGLWGAFDSGASSALLYDSLKALKRENEFKKIQGNALFFAQVSLGLTALVGAYVYTLNIRYPFVLAFFGFCIALVASVLFEEPPIKKKNTSFVAHFLDSLSFVWKTPAVRWIVVYNSLIISFYFIFFRNLIQPYIQSVGVDILLFGIFFALFRFSAAVGSKFSVRFEKMLGGWRMLFLLPILFALSYLLMGIFPSVYG